MKEGKTPEEDLLRMIDGFQEDLRSATTLEEVKRMVATELGEPRDALAEMLWDVLPTEHLFEEHGIRTVGFRHAWGTEARWGIQGVPGLWSYDVVAAIREEEEW